MTWHSRPERALSNCAFFYRELGWTPIPIPPKKKAPVLKGWQQLDPSEEQLQMLFADPNGNIGILLGERSGWLVDVDLDCEVARHLASVFLPATLTFGRPTAPDSHYIYVSEGAKTAKFTAPVDAGGKAGRMLVELRSTGCQTVFPPSIHPSGEPIEWTQSPSIMPVTQVDAGVLRRRVALLAAATLCVYNWPEEGGRQSVAGALAGLLARAGFDADEADQCVRSIAREARDEESAARGQFARATVQNTGAGRATTGLPTFARLMGDDVARRVAGWLGPTPSTEQQEKESNDKTLAAVLVDLARSDGAHLFRTPDGVGHASLPGQNGRVATALRSSAMERWLGKIFYGELGRPVSANTLSEAIGALEAQAIYGGDAEPVHSRVADLGPAVCIDLGLAEAVEVRGDGWKLTEECGVHFRRPNTLLPMPKPQRGAKLEALRPFLNIGDEGSWRLLVTWMLASLRPSVPCPVLILTGEQGSAKSTTAKLIKSLLDPGKAPLRSLSRDERDLMIVASNSRLLAFDNLSGMPGWMSDALCRLVTGGGFSTRALFTNDEEAVFEAMRAIILNGIDDLVSRPDLGDRSLVLTLPAIPEERRAGQELEARFAVEAPKLLGAVLDSLAGALAELPRATKDVERAPRMIEFARLGVAAERALGWPPGSFMQALTNNDSNLKGELFESDRVAVAVLKLMEDRDVWHGTATELLDELRLKVSEETARSKKWPRSAQALSSRLRRAAPLLRNEGIDVQSRRGRRRVIELGRLARDRDARDVRVDEGGARSERRSIPGTSAGSERSEGSTRQWTDDADDAGVAPEGA